MELEKVKTKQELEIKKPLTRGQALNRIYQLEKDISKVKPENPNFVYWYNKAGEGDNDFSLKGNQLFDIFLPRFPLMPSVKITNSTLVARKSLARYSWVVGVISTGVSLSLFGISAYCFIPFLLGAFVSGFYTTRFYDGSKNNKLRWILSSIFLGKKSRRSISSYMHKAEEFESLKESFELLSDLVRKEIEMDNLLEIVNEESDKDGNYITYLPTGKFVKINREKYQTISKSSEKSLTTEEKKMMMDHLLKEKLEELIARQLERE